MIVPDTYAACPNLIFIFISNTILALNISIDYLKYKNNLIFEIIIINKFHMLKYPVN